MFCIYREVDVCTYVFPGSRCGLGGIETPDVVFRFRQGSSAGGARAESLVGCDEGFSAGVSARVQMWTKYQFGPCGVLRQRWCGILRGELVVAWCLGEWPDTEVVSGVCLGVMFVTVVVDVGM